jgi:TPR repeat protein
MSNRRSQPSTSAQIGHARAAFKRKDWGAAIERYERLARLGSPEAMMRLARIYDAGEASSAKEFRDLEAARYWYEMAYSKADLVGAALGLGEIYHFGRGVPVDYEKAFSYYKRFEGTTSAVGLMRLGIMYQLGHGVQQDAEKARWLYGRAAKLGNIFARKNLGVLLWKHWHNPKGLFLWGWAICQAIYFFIFKRTSARIRA